MSRFQHPAFNPFDISNPDAFDAVRVGFISEALRLHPVEGLVSTHNHHGEKLQQCYEGGIQASLAAICYLVAIKDEQTLKELSIVAAQWAKKIEEARHT